MRRPGTLVPALATALFLILLPAGPAPADGGEVPPPAADRFWFGPGLDWTRDSAAAYADRLGSDPSLYAQRVRYPLADADVVFLRQFAEQAAAQGAVLVVDLEPQEALEDLTDRDARRLAAELSSLHEDLGSLVLLRFAPEMNGSWVPWGQRPRAYVTAFRRVADAVHRRAPGTAVVWSPAYGAGYPFGEAYGAVPAAGPRREAQLDTDGNGRVDDADDPYGPYYPGDRAVDWVGLSVYRFGAPGSFGAGSRARPGELEERLDERLGYGRRTEREPFYERFATGPAQPLLLETAALFGPGGDQGDEVAVKRSWWRQVLDVAAERPLLAGVSWLEQRRPEAEARGRVVDWRATADTRVAAALGEDLAASRAVEGPVTEPQSPGDSSPGAAGQEGAGQEEADADGGSGTTLAVLAGVAALLVAGAVLRRRRAVG